MKKGVLTLPTHKKKIPFNKPFIVGNELEYIAEAINMNGHLSGNGPFTDECQKWLENHFSCKKALLTHSCTGALEMASLICNIQPGDEIILPSFTFVSTANAFVLRGATPVFIDIRNDTLNMDETKIEQAITGHTKAIVPVHYAGVSCEMDEIMEIAKTHDLWVIEDAAQSFNSQYKGRHLGTIGDLGCLSFHETKNVISGEGGALYINQEQLINRAQIIWEKGTNRVDFQNGCVDKYTWIDMGSSYLPGELTSAFLYSQLEHSKKIIAKRLRLFGIYYKELEELEQKNILKRPFHPEHCTTNGHLFYILLSDASHQKPLIRFLKEHQITSVFHYIPLHDSPAGMKYGRTSGSMDITNSVYKKIIRLPLFYELEDSAVLHITDLIKKYFNSL